MATELRIEEKTVEPLISHASKRQPATPAARHFKWADVETRLERCMLGRLTLGGMRWGIVAGLIITGYFTAAGIDSGLTALRDTGTANAQQILAASAANK